MSASLWNSLLHLLRSLWIFLCKLCHLRAKRDSTTVLPVALPPQIIAQGIIINICAPPEDLLAGKVPSLANFPNSDYHKRLS